MPLSPLLFPPESRTFPGERWTHISLRTLHLIGMAGMGAAFLYPIPGQSWIAYLYLTLASGLVQTGLFIWSNGIWLIQLRGQAILVKLLLLVLIPLLPDLGVWLFLSVVVISGLISHAPGDVRYYSLYHRRRIERL